MPDQKTTVDPFKPQQPAIPGVPRGGAKTPSKLKLPPVWVSLTLAAFLFIGAGVVWWNRPPRQHPATTHFALSIPQPVSAKATEPALPTGPGEIATTGELERLWSGKKFLFRNPNTNDTTLAEVVHVPGGYWAFSLKEPFGNCQLVYQTDVAVVQHEFHAPAAEHPMVVDPCDGTVFDLAKYGSSPSGLVRGEVVVGPGIRPPIAIEVKTSGNKIIAARWE
jgi:hypothetical protein